MTGMMDPFFSSSVKTKPVRTFKSLGRGLDIRTTLELAETVDWATHLADPVGGFSLAMDATFGSGDWSGKRRGRKCDRRDFLCLMRKRGFDGDDALRLFRQFCARVVPHCTWIAAAEPNPNHGGINEGFHLHAMLAGDDQLKRKRVHDLWVAENGWCKVNPIRSVAARGDYCMKHLVRRGFIQLDWNFGTRDLWMLNRRLPRPACDAETVPLERPGGEPI
jgi:hypothetical protein